MALSLIWKKKWKPDMRLVKGIVIQNLPHPTFSEFDKALTKGANSETVAVSLFVVSTVLACTTTLVCSVNGLLLTSSWMLEAYTYNIIRCVLSMKVASVKRHCPPDIQTLLGGLPN